MQFFVSWTRSDPIFQIFDSEANILVSPASVTKQWNISKWPCLPSQLFIDSGAYSKKNRIPTSQEVLNNQIYISSNWRGNNNLYFSHPDILIPPKCTYKEKVNIIKHSLERAGEYFQHLRKTKKDVIPVGVIHGFDEETILNSYFYLREIGYNHFALGSIGKMMSMNKKLCMDAILFTESYDIGPLHLFGITFPLNEKIAAKNIKSFDSSSTVKLAIYGTVLYGVPLRRYVISPTKKQIFRDDYFGFREKIDKPLPCECPICKTDNYGLLCKDQKTAKNNRIIHNYFQIKWASQ